MPGRKEPGAPKGGAVRRPLTILALLFGAGTALGLAPVFSWVSVHALFGIAVVAWLLAFGFVACDRILSAQWIAIVLICLLGLLSARLPRGGVSLAVLLPLEADARVQATIAGVIAQEPDSDSGSPMRLLLQAQEVAVDGMRYQVQETIPLLVYGQYRWPPRKWDHWSFSGTLQYTPENYRGEWLLVTGVSQSSRKGPPITTLSVWSDQLRRLAAEALRQGLEDRPDRYGVVHALLLGYRAHLPSDVLQAFRRTGTMHVFAISGLHVGIICAVLVFVINLLRVPRTCRVLALAPVILLYAFMTGARASAVRAGVMAVTYLAASFVGRKGDSWSALALSAILILAWRPDQLQDPGFIFSFTAVAGILTFVPLFEAGLQRYLLVDPFRAKDEGIGVVPSVLLWAGRLMAVSIAAWLSTTPLSLYYFGRFAPVALLANVIVLPLAFLIVITGALSLLAAATGGLSWATLFNQANYAYVGGLTGGMRLLERIPGAYVENLRVSLPVVLTWYVLLFGSAFWLRRRFAKQDTGTVLDLGL